MLRDGVRELSRRPKDASLYIRGNLSPRGKGILADQLAWVEALVARLERAAKDGGQAESIR